MNLQLKDESSASTDLYSLLRCEPNWFDSRVHDVAVQRLVELPNKRTSITMRMHPTVDLLQSTSVAIAQMVQLEQA